MEQDYWNSPLNGGVSWNWIETTPSSAEPEDRVWQVRPASGDLQDPATTGRNKNSIGTKCNYSDFHITFYFRCPNTRGIFDECTNKIKSPQNWGNSGIKILDVSGYEVQIMDSFNFTLPAGTNPLTMLTGPADPSDPSGFKFCGTGPPVDTEVLGKLMLGDICGAIYHQVVPMHNPVKEAENSMSIAYTPEGDWNFMDISFMAARYKWDESNKEWDRIKCSTISVKINNTQVHYRVGLAPTRVNPQGQVVPLFDETSRLICDSVYDEPNNPKGYCKASGIILLQEHDNAVEFRDIRINPQWLPGSGTFDKNWQRFSGCTGRAD